MEEKKGELCSQKRQERKGSVGIRQVLREAWVPTGDKLIMSGATESTLFQSLVGKERSIAREVSLQRIKVGGELKIFLRP